MSPKQQLVGLGVLETNVKVLNKKEVKDFDVMFMLAILFEIVGWSS